MNNSIHILLAEDEPALGQIIKESLETRDFKVSLCTNGQEAWDGYQTLNPDILVLDVMMPKKDGFTLAKEIRTQDSSIPILFLTAKSQTQDVVEGFNIGGNDYLKKPFSMEELIVRIKNLLDRAQLIKQETAIPIGRFSFNATRQELSLEENEPQKLTHRESQLLFYLCANRNAVLDRSFILKKLWGNDDFFNARSMDVFISNLRKKLKADKNVQIINVRGFGYKLICQ